MTVEDDKKSLRSEMKRRRDSISLRKEKSLAVSELLLSSDIIGKADLVLCYISVGSEVSTRYLIDELIASGKPVAAPKCTGEGKMEFFLIRSRNDLEKGKYGIPQPDKNCRYAEISKDTVCIVPGLSFTISGDRLGYGGGYYDRFLSLNRGLRTVGLTFEELIMPSLPCGAHDTGVKYLATEKRLVMCSGK